METIGDRIRRRRKALKIGVKDLARASELAVSTIYDIENGNQDSSTKLHLIAKHLRLNVEWLETGNGPKEVGEAAAPRANDSVIVHGLQLTLEAARLGEEWLKLDEPNRSAMMTAIYTMVAAQKRGDKKKPTPRPSPRPPTS